jgi:segregation and condensation protein A
MMNDQELINLMVNEPSWEDVIVKIVAEEQMDPWNIDIVKLADAFSDYVTKMDQSDLRIPARFILIAAILVRMKSDIFAEKRQRMIIDNELSKDKQSELIQMLAKIPPLQAPVNRIPLKSVALDELVGALKKAFEVEDRRTEKKWKTRKNIDKVLPQAEADDITKRIDAVMSQIQDAMKEIDSSIEFSRLVSKWERKNIVRILLPLLHLSQEGKVSVDQKELFKEIYVGMKKHG